MALVIGPEDFAVMLADLGRTVTLTPYVAGAADALGETTWTAGSPSSIQAIVQDVSSEELRQLAGILEVGDKWLFVAGSQAIAPTDRILIDGRTFRTVEEEAPTIGDAPTRPYRRFLLRRV